MTDTLPDHYGILEIEIKASEGAVRKAFRRRLLEVHPDKAANAADPALLDAVMHAFEVLSDTRRREEYDRRRELQARHMNPLENLPHVTESERPVDRARAILFFLVSERGGEALSRLESLEEDPLVFLTRYLDDEEFIDSAFLLAELYEIRDAHFEALRWYQEILRVEGRRRYHRPCYDETVDRTKRLLIQTISSRVDPRTSLEYLRRVESLGLDRNERADVHKRRAQAFLQLDMRVEAARQLELALTTYPGIKGVSKLREELDV